MTANDIRNECKRSIAFSDSLGIKNNGIQLFVPGSWPETGRKKLAGRFGGPYGECVAELEDGCLCVFNPQEILDWLDKKQAEGKI